MSSEAWKTRTWRKPRFLHRCQVLPKLARYSGESRENATHEERRDEEAGEETGNTDRLLPALVFTSDAQTVMQPSLCRRTKDSRVGEKAKGHICEKNEGAVA
ncbi:hypothetical protein TGRUB_273940 [Toxoplasma gondii RUB]|uniref:Uncharacterized protein n=3 Tax=Toxoplasma gondii TaxID=5811 RepID=A0A086M512_TOXGO|nr:hypothetical protein TGP89_273940 [Toxoplasma gondii p89]KFG63980.1 hypothetical protein TGRUB_273940 [Toxoplasma gondii RUB]KFH11533.1 hypothetical protein TGVAND_273940 [Toxoplasma gondii VAND]